jgi:hypothetical protein
MRMLSVAGLLLTFSATTLPAQPSGSGIRHVLVTVAATNDEWTPSGLTVSAGDMVIVRAPGYIQIGGMSGERDAAGYGHNGTTATPNGSLEYKVGVSAGKPAGKFDVHVVDDSGELKFRVRDSDYRDNRGQFEVDVIVLPPSSIPPAPQRPH